MSSQDDKRLIVGLGNPGTRYELTRHNYGFMVVHALAQRHGLSFRKPFRVNGQVATGMVQGRKTFFLMPHTYMNLSGEAVIKMMRLHHITVDQLIVIVDDVAIPFGEMRLRSKGGTGGHKGLASLEEVLQTQDYLRLRMGIGNDQLAVQPLEAFVLSRFSDEEQAQLPKWIEESADLIEHWLKSGTESALKQAGSMK